MRLRCVVARHSTCASPKAASADGAVRMSAAAARQAVTNDRLAQSADATPLAVGEPGHWDRVHQESTRDDRATVRRQRKAARSAQAALSRAQDTQDVVGEAVATAQLAAAKREATRARLSAAMGKGQPPSDAPLPGSGSNFWAWRTGPEGRRVLRDRAKQIDSLYSHDRKGVARSVDETEHEIRAREASLQVTRRAKKGIPAQPVDAAMLDHFAAVRSRVTAR